MQQYVDFCILSVSFRNFTYMWNTLVLWKVISLQLYQVCASFVCDEFEFVHSWLSVYRSNHFTHVAFYLLDMVEKLWREEM